MTELRHDQSVGTTGPDPLTRDRAVLATLKAMLVGVDDDDRVRLWSAAVEAGTGVPEARALGRPIPDALTTAERRDALTSAIGAARRGRARELVLPFPRVGREPGAVRWQIRRVPDNAGGPLTLLAGSDVTEAVELEVRAAEAQALLAMGRLTAALAHEFKNPLNAALLQLELLRRLSGRVADRGSGEEMGLCVLSVQGQVNRLSRLLDDFLGLARPERLERALVDVGRVLTEVVELHRESASSAAVVLEVVMDGPTPSVFADASRLRLALVSLVANAIDACEARGSGLVQVFARLDVGGMVTVLVRDDGAGLAAPAHQLMQPFVSTRTGSAGLGLPLVAQIARLHGGGLRLAPRDGRGTDAYFTLPRAPTLDAPP